MNKSVRKLFSCCLNNKVVAIDTNFKHFHKSLKNYESKCNSDRWYIDKFKENPEFEQTIGNKVLLLPEDCLTVTCMD